MSVVAADGNKGHEQSTQSIVYQEPADRDADRGRALIGSIDMPGRVVHNSDMLTMNL